MKYLTPSQIELLLKSSKPSVHTFLADRNYALILLLFRHGLRAIEASQLRWDNIDFQLRTIAISRVKGSVSGVHPLQPDEVSILKRLRTYNQHTSYVFLGNNSKSLSTRSIGLIVKKAGIQAAFTISIHPHMLRHSCGYWLASKGIDTRTIQAWLGHANIENTVIYTELTPNRFNTLWK